MEKSQRKLNRSGEGFAHKEETMYELLLLLHVLGATIWTGGHIVLLLVILPSVLRQRSPEMLLRFESAYEKIGMPALIVQVITGLMLAHKLLPNLTQWFNPANPLSHPIMAKLCLLLLTLGFALNARLRVIPRLSPATLGLMAWHILTVTLLSVAFVMVGLSFRTGWLY